MYDNGITYYYKGGQIIVTVVDNKYFMELLTKEKSVKIELSIIEYDRLVASLQVMKIR